MPAITAAGKHMPFPFSPSSNRGVLAPGPQVVDQRERGKTNGGANPRPG